MDYFIGIDVQLKPGLSFAVLDAAGHLVDSGWLEPDFGPGLQSLLDRHGGSTFVGIDSPRLPLTQPRPWYWNRRDRSWRPREKEAGCGRHCEVVVSALRLAKPQWTRVARECPDWMQLGFELFRALFGRAPALEVFPSASYSQLSDDRSARVEIDFSGFVKGPKDMLDACLAALTVRELIEGRGCEVGGGDGLGTIVLPRPVDDPLFEPLQSWPR